MPLSLLQLLVLDSAGALIAMRKEIAFWFMQHAINLFLKNYPERKLIVFFLLLRR